MSSSSTTGGLRTGASLDLVNLAKWPASFTYDALVRLSKANVESSTVAAAQATCACFDLSARAQQEFAARLKSLPVMALYGGIAWFGFGLRHVLEDVADRDHGTTCLALCGCLMESYPPFFGAQVMRKLCALQSAPEDLIPGSQQWQGLLKVTGGILCGSRFPKMVHIFSRLLVPTSCLGTVRRGATDPEIIAIALLQLARISKGELHACIFSGGLDCAWLAAVAAFLFNFKTEIRDSDGNCLYRHHPLYCLAPICVESALPCKHQHVEDSARYVAQVTFYPNPTTATAATAATATATLVSRSFSIPDGRDLFFKDPPSFQETVEIYSRSPWTSILHDSFGVAAGDLLGGPAAYHFACLFAFIVQRAGRLRSHDPFANADEIFAWPDLAFAAQMLDAESSLFELAMHRLPELQSCLGEFTNSRSASIVMAEADGLRHMKAIQIFCGCPACSSSHVPHESFICLRALAGTVILYAGLLSVARIHQGILPTPYGLRSLYNLSAPGEPWTVGKDSAWRYMWPDDRDLLLSVSRLFWTTDNTYKNQAPGALSVVADGLCCYYKIMESPDTMPVEASRVHVIPGYISFRSGIYERIENLQLEQEPWTELLQLEPQNLSMYISESMEGHLLYAAYQAQSLKSSESSSWYLFSIASICSFAAREALQGEGRRYVDRLQLLSRCNESLEYRRKDRFLESSWRIVSQNPANNAAASLHSCRAEGHDAAPRYSLLVIIADRDNLKVFKSSMSSSLSIGCIYAGYARNYHCRIPLDRSVCYKVVRISDCPNCVLSFVADVWPQLMVPLPEDRIRGQITFVGTGETDPRTGHSSHPKNWTVGFELHKDHSFIPDPERLLPLPKDHMKPHPPGPLLSELNESATSTFVKHFKYFVGAKTAKRLFGHGSSPY